MNELVVLQEETRSWDTQRIKSKYTGEIILSSMDVVLCNTPGLSRNDMINVMSLSAALKITSQLSDSEILSVLKSYTNENLLNLLRDTFTRVEL